MLGIEITFTGHRHYKQLILKGVKVRSLMPSENSVLAKMEMLEGNS